MKFILIALLVLQLSCGSDKNSPQEFENLVPLGPLNKDIRSIHSSSIDEKRKSPDGHSLITWIRVDLDKMELSLDGSRFENPSTSCHFERALALTEYQQIREAYRKVEICRYETNRSTPCPMSQLARFILFQTTEGSLAIYPIEPNACSAPTVNCRVAHFMALESELENLFQADFNSCQ